MKEEKMTNWVRAAFGVHAILLSSVVLASATSVPVTLRIDAQPLDSALNSWAQQTGYSVLVPIDGIAESKITRKIAGIYTAEAALKSLLDSSNLKYEFVNARTVAIRTPATYAGRQEGQEGLAEVRSDFVSDGSQKARSDSRIRSSHGNPDETIVRNEGNGSDNNVPGVPANEKRGLPEVLITGSKTLNTDIRRSRDDTQPYVVIDRSTIERSGVTNLESLLRKQLTMSTSSSSPSTETGVYGGTSRINLRGLGSDETLILIDGRRVAGFGNSSLMNQPDINGIPLSAVERIEVLPATASGIYGGGATGGVVNIVLRRDYSGMEGKFTYGDTLDVDRTTRRLDLSGGATLEGGKTTLLLAASWSDMDDLLSGERDFARRARNHALANNPSAFFSASVPPIGATTNIRSTSGVNLTLKSNGSSLGSPFTSVPYGYAGPASDGGAALLGNAGHYNLDLPNSAETTSPGSGSLRSLLNAPTVKSIISSIRRSFTPQVDVFAEVSASENSSSFTIGPSLGAIIVPATAVSNPFNEQIRVVTPTLGVQQRIESTLKVQRAAVGLVAGLPGAWTFGADYTWNRTENSFVNGGAVANASATAAVANGSLNIFRDTNEFPADFAPYLLSNSFGTPSSGTLQDSMLHLSGNIPIRLPGGQPTLTLLLEHRQDARNAQYSVSESRTRGNFNRALFPDASQDVDSAYMEALLPFISPSKNLPGLRTLELQLSGRYDRYRTDGVQYVPVDANFVPLEPIVRQKSTLDSVDPTVGVRYAPVSDVTLRASYGTGFLPPSVSQLVSITSAPINAAVLRDPLRNNEPLGVVTITTGGSPDLRPEESTSKSAGIVIRPRFASDLRASIDWVRIKKRDNITTPALSQQGLSDLINYLPNRINRSPSSGGSIGPITAIDVSLVNLARLDVESFDFAVDYELGSSLLGSFDVHLGATRLVSLKTQQTPVAPTVEYAGVGSAGNVGSTGDGGGLRWSAIGTLNWHRGGMTVGWTARFFDSYFLNPGHTVVASQGSATVPSQIYHDLFASYRFASSNDGVGLLDGLEIQFGLNNVFNTSPPVDVVGNGVSSSLIGYSFYGDPRLANYYLSVKKSFGGVH